MAGIYVHIPFCKQACYYCDFHFSTNLSYRNKMVEAICQEIELRKGYLTETVETVYFGGGTPSLLEQGALAKIMVAVSQHFKLSATAEITLEANPDDLHPGKLAELRQVGINRLSIGIQSFHPPHLQYLNRLHTAEQAIQCVQQAQEAGFNNITIDLIYGIHSPDHRIWEADLQQAVSLGTDHISAYCLTIEEKTVFGNWQKKGIIRPVDDSFAATQFNMLVDYLASQGFEQYEVSNFARNGRYSRHNTAYWQQKPYLGIGPGSHSFNLESRQFNLPNNHRYMQAMAEGDIPYEMEQLSDLQKCNEYLLTRLRTMWGCDLGYFSRFGYDLGKIKMHELAQMKAKRWLTEQGNHIRLTKAGLLQADYITEQLFLE